MIDKHIDARHPARCEITPADTVVGLSAIIRTVKCVAEAELSGTFRTRDGEIQMLSF